MKNLNYKFWKLEPIQKTDQNALFQVIDNNRGFLEKWLPFVSETKTIKDLSPFIDFVSDPIQVDHSPVFLIKSNDSIIGLIGFKNTDTKVKQTEIGYWLVEKKQGNGIISTAMEELLEFAFIEKEMKKVIVKCGVENFPSRRIPEKLGFKINQIETKGVKMGNGEWVDIVHYELNRNDYQVQS
jgi:ribosomal-protein-serine acetyltransferase